MRTALGTNIIIRGSEKLPSSSGLSNIVFARAEVVPIGVWGHHSHQQGGNRIIAKTPIHADISFRALFNTTILSTWVGVVELVASAVGVPQRVSMPPSGVTIWTGLPAVCFALKSGWRQ